MLKTAPRLTVLLTCTAILTLSNCAMTQATAENESFVEAYQRVSEAQTTSDTELRKQGDNAAAKRQWNLAIATYMIEANHALRQQNSEQARLAFDKAFALADHLDAQGVDQLLQKLSLITSDYRIRDVQIDDYKYFAQKRLLVLSKQSTQDWNRRYYDVQTLALTCSQHKRYEEAENLLIATSAILRK